MEETLYAALFLFIAQDRGGVQTRLVIDTTPGITNRYNPTSFAIGEISRTHILRNADDATFSPSKWDTNNSTFPGHPHRQCFDLIKGHLRAIADTTLGRAAIDIVLNTIACKRLNSAVVETHREIDG